MALLALSTARLATPTLRGWRIPSFPHSTPDMLPLGPLFAPAMATASTRHARHKRLGFTIVRSTRVLARSSRTDAPLTPLTISFGDYQCVRARERPSGLFTARTPISQTT